MCDKVISADPFMLVYCPDRWETQKICNEAVDDCLAALNFIPVWFVTGKMIKNILTALCAGTNILYFNEDSRDFTFSCNEMSILSVDLNNINLDDTNYDKDDSNDFWLSIMTLKNVKHLKKSQMKN